MKRLWKLVPPCLSDILGFQDVMNHTDGMGVVDDSSNYKPLNRGRGGMGGKGGRPEGRPEGGADRGGMSGGWHGRGGEHGGGRPWGNGERGGGRPWGGERHGRGQDGEGGGRPRGKWEERSDMGDGGRKGGFKRGGGGFSDVRVVASEIQETDVVVGTAEKVMQAFERGKERFQPTFALLTTAPCAAMISTDLNELAGTIQSKYGIPAAAVDLDGQKDYLYGVSCTLEAIGKLLLEKRDTLPHTVNLLGCNTIDWPEAAIQETVSWLASAGFRVLTKWGAQETAENLKNASAASVNLVVNISGLRLAQYMEQEFQIPYVVGAPFGAKQCWTLSEQLKNRGVRGEAPAGQEPEALVIGEQLMADAIRNELLERGWGPVRVCSFFEMDKGLMQPGDLKLLSEDDLSQQLAGGSLKAVFGDSDYQLPAGSALRWIPLPNPANQAPSAPLAPFSMVNEALDCWLDGQLGSAGE